MENKMTDNEIIMALECCGQNVEFEHCADCPFNNLSKAICTIRLSRVALDFINRQKAENSNLSSDLTSLKKDLTSAKAEIERLQRHNNEYGFCNLLGNCLVYSKNLDDYNAMRAGLKSEGIKEFAEELKQKFEGLAICTTNSINAKIDSLEKEKVGKE